MKKITFNSLRSSTCPQVKWLAILMLFFVLGSFSSYAQTTYYSKSSATDFNSVASWGTATDGTGTAPGSISNADNFIVANNSAMTLSANATVRQLTITAGTLTVAANTLNIGIASQKTSFLLINGGTFTVSGGVVNIDGYLSYTAGNFNQSNGSIVIDPNNGGVAATSTTSSQYTLSITATNGVNWTGGSITLLDPPASTSSSHYSLYYNGGAASEVSLNHTLKFGDGTSADAGGNAIGFLVYNWVGSYKINFGNWEIYGPTGTNRKVKFQSWANGIKGNITILNGGELDQNSIGLIVGGNINVNTGGILTANATITFANPVGTGSVTNTVNQSVIASGTIRNLSASPTANFTSVTVNTGATNTVTFPGTTNIATNPANSMSASGTITFTNGLVAMTSGVPFILGTSAPASGTVSYTAGGFVSGTTFGRWFTATGTGTTITAAADPTGSGGRYPFVNSSYMDRSVFIERNTPAGAAGLLAVTYVAGSGYTNTSLTDGAVTTNRKGNDVWTTSILSGTPTAAANLELAVNGLGVFGGALNAANARLVQGTAYVGTHQAGTVTPGAQRLLTPAEFVGSYSITADSADFTPSSIASGNWNNPATWSTGVVPSCTDIVTITPGFTVTVNSTANVCKSLSIQSGGTLVVASGDLTTGCTLFNNTFVNNGTLTVSGGTLNINGSMTHAPGSTFNQSGGDINVDGNDGGAVATSVSAPIVSLNTNLINLTGGTLTIVDPHTNTSGQYTLSCNIPNSAVDLTSGNHTLRFGNGTSTDAGGYSSYGFRVYVSAGSFRISFNNFVVNGGSGTNRFVSTSSAFGVNGDFTINAGSEYYDISGYTTYIAGNLVNNGTLTATSSGTIYMGTFLNATAGASTKVQTISGSGVFRNNATPASVTANLLSLTINNTNAAGVTLSVPLSLSGTLTLTAGKINTTTASLLTVGTATVAGTITGGSATAYVSGPLARTIASGNANTNYITFPVGKTAYAPILLAPTTTAVTVMKAEAFDTNTGTMDPSIINLAANRRWEAPVVSGTVTNLNIRLGDANITATKIPVQAPAAAAAYTAAFGSVATYAAGTPNTTTTNAPITAANYTGFLSFADSNSCSGTPAPGNTIASATNICQGTTVNFSVQNGTTGSGVTYQWQTSPDNATYTDISGATSTTYSAAPTASLYYRLKVTCASGPSIGYSTPVQITFPNSVTASTGATRCGVGSAAISATPSAGASILWFDSVAGSNIIGAGNNLTTPVVTATTSFYAAAETLSAGNVTIGNATTLTTDTQQPTAFCNRWGGYRMQILYTAAELYAMGLRAGNITSITFNTTTPGDGLTNDNFTVSMGSATGSAIGSSTFVTTGLSVVYGPVTHTHTASGLQTITFSTPYSWNGTSGILLEVSHNGANLTNNARTYYTATTGNTILYATSTTATTGTLSTSRLNVIFAGQVGCSSARVPVTVTVNPAPALTLSGNPAVICAGNTTAPVTITAGAASYDTYSWSPSTGVSGSAAAGWTFNPTTTTTYVLTATQSGGTMCAADPISVLVSVNLQPSATISLPSALTACQQSPQAIVLTNAVGSQNAALGNGTTAPATTSYPNPFSAFYGGTKTQILFTADELIAQGLMPGSTISTLSFDFNASVASALNDFRIKIGTTTNTTTTAGFVASSSLTTVYNASYTPTANTTGLVPFTLTTPYTWNGGNLIVEIAHNQGNGGNGSGTTTNTTTTSFNSVYTGASDSVTPAGMTSFDALTSWSVSSASTSRPNVVFGYNPNNTVVWSPATNLYTDAAATIAYSGQSVATVYTKLNSNATYTATVTNSFGCSRAKTVNVTVNIVAAPTVAAPTQDICNAGTVADLVATGTAIKWYAAATGGTALASTTALVNGTTYYASQTVSGCESITRTARTANINVVASPTIANANQTFCNAGTVADLMPNDASIKWYAAATGGTALVSTTALVNGTTYYASQTVSGCEGLSRGAVTATLNVVAAPAISNDDQVFCNNATIADLLPNGAEIKWYNVATGGTALLSTDALVSGTTYYASQTVSGCEGLLRGAVTATVLVTPAPTAEAAQTFCNAATVADLVPNDASIKWYAAATGGTALVSTTALVSGTSYFASQTVDGCEGLIRTEVVATINVTAAPTGDDEQEFCGSAVVGDLAASGDTITWYDAATDGTVLTVDTALVDGTTYYASQSIDGCEGLTRFAVTAVIHNVVVDAPADVNVCTEYVLPALTNGAYFTQAGGQGVEVAAGSTVTSTTTLYVYAQEGADVVCSDENTFTVTVANVPAPTGNASQTIEGGVAADVTVSDLVTDAVTGIVTWYATLEDAQAGTNALTPDTQLVQGATYYAIQTIDTCTSVDVFAVTVEIVLERGGFDVKAFSYYPNPVKDVLNLSYSSEITSVTVFNLLGQKVISQVSNATDVRVDMSSLADGAYIVNVASGNTVKTVKVIKKQ